jgi:hypothetical protein
MFFNFFNWINTPNTPNITFYNFGRFSISLSFNRIYTHRTPPELLRSTTILDNTSININAIWYDSDNNDIDNITDNRSIISRFNENVSY